MAVTRSNPPRASREESIREEIKKIARRDAALLRLVSDQEERIERLTRMVEAGFARLSDRIETTSRRRRR